MDTKICTKCRKIKTVDQFYKRKAAKDGLQSECKDCRNAAVKKWKTDNPERARKIDQNRVRDHSKQIAKTKEWRRTPEGKRKMLGYRLMADHGITLEQYEDLLERQGGVCAICHRPPPGGSPTDMRLHVDHCHKKGTIRGLLCRPCNTAIGLLGEDPERIAAAAEYVREGRWVRA